MKIRFVSCIVFLVIVSVQSLFGIKKDTKLILDEMARLQAQVMAMDEKVTIISTDMSSLYKKVKILEERMSVINKSFADNNQSKETLALNLQFIKESINDLKNSLSLMSDKVKKTGVQNSSNTTPINQNEQTISNKEQKDVIENKNLSASTTPPSDSAENLYYAAYSDYLKHNYDLAISGFNQLLVNYPKNSFADNSLYWIGECYYSQKKYKEAINYFTKLLENYKDGDKTTSAMLKKAYSLINMGNKEGGRSLLKSIVEQYPLSEEASLARQKIKEITG